MALGRAYLGLVLGVLGVLVLGWNLWRKTPNRGIAIGYCLVVAGCVVSFGGR